MASRGFNPVPPASVRRARLTPAQRAEYEAQDQRRKRAVLTRQLKVRKVQAAAQRKYQAGRLGTGHHPTVAEFVARRDAKS